MSKKRFIDLFAGIGGFRMGFESNGYKCVFSSEKNTACQEVYKNNFGEKPFGDITQIDLKSIPDFEVLLGGFPCQPFSISGKKKGFKDTRGTLFFNICQIIDAKKPKVVVLENVKHLIYHDKKRTLKVIIDSLKDLGYNVSTKVLNAKDFGLPQNRERIFIIASQKSFFDFNLIPKQPTPKLKDFLDTDNNSNFKFLDKSEYTLIDSPKRQATGLIFTGYRNKNQWKKGVRPNTSHLSRVHRQPNRIYSIDGVHPTIPSQEISGRFFIYLPETNQVRKLTINECYRIMGFPPDFKKHTRIGEQYKQIGNSVAVTLIDIIAKQIIKQNLLSDAPQTEIRENLQALLFKN